MNILITGGGGSLGQAFARRLHKNHKVTLLDNNEWSLAKCDLLVEKLLMDYEDWRFNEHPCDVVIHTAAYKHVEMGESNPTAFVENNITKYITLLKEAYMGNAQVLFISTDKAVEPISLYGFTKSIGERLTYEYNGHIARLGNILGSSGSVIPKWEECILNKEPIPITDEDMTRFVIEDYEAVDQIWDMFKAGKKLIIPKCKKIRLMDLLDEVLKKHGYGVADEFVSGIPNYEPGVIRIGLRDGEKLEEKLKWDTEES